MKNVMDAIKTVVRGFMAILAKFLDTISRGKITPNAVTWTALIMHLPIAFLIMTNHLIWAALLLIIFGLFDSLDGALARQQKKVTDKGGLLDTVTDRLKEILVYTGIAYLFAITPSTAHWVAPVVVLACGLAVVIPFVKSKGETIVASQGKKLDYPTINRMFGGGFLPYEIRIGALVVGLLGGVETLPWFVLALAVAALFTTFQRLILIIKSVK